MVTDREPLELSMTRNVELVELCRAARGDIAIAVAPETLAAMDHAHALARERAARAPVYGLSTGFGPMVAVAVPAAASVEMQYNLVRSHAAGMGAALPADLSRAILIARLRSLTRVRSAVPGALARHIAALIGAELAPIVPRKGGVGASGDLVQLAHMALLVIGEGECWHLGSRTAAARAYAGCGLEPYRLTFRDGLALVNGTSAMTAVAAFCCVEAARLLDCAVALSCMLVEVLGAPREPYTAAVHAAKQHAAQAEIARRMRAHLACAMTVEPGPLQEPYAVRCVPQVLGPLLDAVQFASRIVTGELNSASDNPVFDPGTGEALHGGNFHGEPVAQAMDTLKIAVAKCALLLDRQLDLLLDDSRNARLPPFLNAGRPGIDLGLQGVQFTATSTAAECQTLAFPASLHSIPSNKGNQDVVSMGFDAAWIARQVLSHAFDIAAIQGFALSQAAHLTRGAGLSPRSKAHIEAIRNIAPPLTADRSLSRELAALSAHLRAAAM